MAIWLRRLSFVCLAALACAAPADARKDAIEVDLELVLAVDVSGSIDTAEAKLQREGYIAAILNPSVHDVIGRGLNGRIALAYFEWAGHTHQRMVVDWMVIDGAASAERFAGRLLEAPIMISRFTSISAAIAFAMGMFEDNGFRAPRQVIDISGDGPNNDGAFVPFARDFAIANNVTINGLPILNDRPNLMDYPNLPELDLYYRDCVIGGPGAFIVVANGFRDFADAIQRKMILEIAGLAPRPGARLALAKARSSPGCDVGERQLLQWLHERGAGVP